MTCPSHIDPAETLQVLERRPSESKGRHVAEFGALLDALQFFDGTMKGIPVGIESYLDSIGALQREAGRNPH